VRSWSLRATRVKLLVLFDPRQPVIDDKGSATLPIFPLLFSFGAGTAGARVRQLIVNKIGECLSLEWFHDDFIRFQKDSVHSTLHVGVAAD